MRTHTAKLVAALSIGVAAQSWAQQVENPVPCNAPGITVLPYGGTSSCTFTSTFLEHEFLAVGAPGTVVRLAIAGTSGGVVPAVSVFDLTTQAFLTLSDPATGNAVASPVALTTPGGVQFSPPDGEYVIQVSESGLDNTGGYELSLACASGPCDSDGVAPPDPTPPSVPLETVMADTLAPAVDGDAFTFLGNAGSVVRLAVAGGAAGVAPLVEVRDPSGASLAPLQSAFATPSAVDLAVAQTGLHTLLVYEAGHDLTGAYSFSLSCVAGACDSDLDGFLDPDPIAVAYGGTQPPEPERTTGLSSALDVDAFSFAGAAGTTVRVALSGVSGGVAPTFEIRDPSGAIAQAPTSCPTPCSVDVPLGTAGAHRLVIHDTGFDNAGRYQFTLTCQAGTCPAGLPALAPVCTGGNVTGCRDNCRLVPDMSQADVGGVGAAAPADGIGNACQCGDVSGNGRVTTADATLITRSLLVPPTAALAQPALCNVGGTSACTTADAVILTRGLLVPPTATVLQACSPAFK